MASSLPPAVVRRRRLVLPVVCAWAAACWGPSRARAEPPLGAPLDDYMEAAKLLRAGRLDEAVYLFYRGQLRVRIHLLAHPELPPDGEPALFASLSETMGRPVNEYAFGDLPALLVTLDRVLAWHAAHDDPWTPKSRFATAHARVTAGLVQMREYVATQGDEIRAERRANGLPSR